MSIGASFLLGGVVAFVLGGVFVVAGVLQLRRGNRSASTRGAVLAVSNQFRPTVRFQTSDGHFFEHTAGHYNRAFRGYTVGQWVEVTYDPRNPRDARIRDGEGFIGAIFVALGVLFVLFGALFAGVSLLLFR